MAKAPSILSMAMVKVGKAIQTHLTTMMVGAKPTPRQEQWPKSVCDRLLKMRSKRSVSVVMVGVPLVRIVVSRSWI